MDHSTRISRENWRRIERLVNDDCTDEDLLALEQSLQGDPVAQRLMLEYCQLHLDLTMEIRPEAATQAVLQRVAAAEGRESAACDPTGCDPAGCDPGAAEHLHSFRTASEERMAGRRELRQSPIASLWASRNSGLMASLAATLLLLGAFGGWVMRGPYVVQTQEAAVAVGSSTAAGYLVSSNGCDWAVGTPQLQLVGNSVQVGDEISLNEGIAEFRLANGVYLSIEGPASVVLASPSTLMLQYGAVTAHVPWTATDFRASAGSCQFTACDAELGILRQGNRTEVHAFSGEVRVASAMLVHEQEGVAVDRGGTIITDVSGAFARATITAGTALTLTSEGESLRVASTGAKAMPEKFASNLPMAGPLPVRNSYAQAVLSARPWGYWRFEEVEGSRVKNEVPGGIDLEAVGQVRLTGRVGNFAAEFQPDANCCFVGQSLIDALSGAEYSLELWAKPSHPHHGAMLALRYENEPLHSSGLELQGVVAGEYMGFGAPKRVRFVQHNRIVDDRPSGTSCFSEAEYLSRRWQHVVAVKEGAGMRLYLDGKLSATTADRAPLASQLKLVIGQDLTTKRKFVGQLDEVAIYKHALSAAVIAEHYRLAKDRVDEAVPPSKSEA